MADQENYDNNEELMNEQEFMGDNNGDSNNQDEDHNGTNGGAENAGRDDDRKLFVGGLSWETTEKELRDHFGQYGEIESINIKTDPTTGRSRGFAFIVYKEADSIDKVVVVPEHVINNKKVDPKKAKARTGKIFVGGLIPEISDDEIKAYFGQFGNIVDVEMPFDKQKNQRKAFCFITFDSEAVVNDLLKTPKQTISGKEVDVKKATPKPENAPMGMGGGRGGNRNMRGGPRRGGFQKGGYGNSWGSYGNSGGYGGSYGSGGGSYGGGSYGGDQYGSTGGSYDYQNYGGGYGGNQGGGGYNNYGNGGSYGGGSYGKYNSSSSSYNNRNQNFH